MNVSRGWFLGLALLVVTAVSVEAADSPVADAAKRRDGQAVRALLKSGADVSAPQADGATALHWAAHWDDGETAAMLLQAGARANTTNDYGVTPLSLAASNGSLIMVQRLLKAGANPNAGTSTGETALMTSVRVGNLAVAEALLGAGADPNPTGGARDQTALMWAVARSEHDIMRALITHGADIHARSRVRREYVSFGRGDPQGGRLRGAADGTLESDGTRPGVGWINKGGMTALMFAAQQGDLESVKMLVAAGARVNETTPEPSSSVLMFAAHNDHGDVAMFLLDNGADPNLTGAGYTALHLAAARKNARLVEALLTRGANPNVQLTKGTPRADDASGRSILLPEYLIGATPLVLASALNEVTIMRTLARHGADPHLAMKDGTTVLIAAMGINPGILGLPAFRKGSTRRTQDGYTKMAAAGEEGVLETVKLAVELGVDVNAQRVGGIVYHGANPRTQYGRDDGDTALHTATADKLQSVVEFLVAQGARLDIKDKRGLTPLAMAASDKNLIISGADDGGGKLGDPALAATLRKLGAEQ